MEVVPYRKTDYTIRRDQRYLWMAGVAGYVGVRVDIRGSGLSRLVLLPSRQNPLTYHPSRGQRGLLQ